MYRELKVGAQLEQERVEKTYFFIVAVSCLISLLTLICGLYMVLVASLNPSFLNFVVGIFLLSCLQLFFLAVVRHNVKKFVLIQRKLSFGFQETFENELLRKKLASR